MTDDESGENNRTTDHETIREWVEERGGQPARMEDTGSGTATPASSA